MADREDADLPIGDFVADDVRSDHHKLPHAVSHKASAVRVLGQVFRSFNQTLGKFLGRRHIESSHMVTNGEEL